MPLRLLVGDFVSELLAVDGRVAVTTRSLILRPGFLTSEYIGGRRTRYVTPVRVYLVASVIFGAALAFADQSFAVNMDTDRSSRAAWMQGWLWSVLIMMPVFAGMVQAVPREPRYFAEHLVFSMHVHAFGFVVAGLGLYVVELSPSMALDLSVFVTIVLAWLAYLVLAARSHYGVGLVRAGVAGTLLTVGYGMLQIGALIGTAFLATGLGGAS